MRASRITPDHVRPLYDSYSFANISGSICRWLGADPAKATRALPADVLGSLPTHYDKVVLVLIDAFGWAFVEPLLHSDPFLRRFADQGVVSVLTSQFPSTTSAHMTTLHSGQPVGETGVFEWFYYEPLVDRVIAPLLYALATDHGRDTLDPRTAPPEKLYPARTVYESLTERGVHLYAHMSHTLTDSVYTKTMLKGSTIIPSLSYSGALVDLANTLARDPAPAFHFLYEPIIDTMLHVYGPGAPQVQAEIATLLYALEHTLHTALATTSASSAHKTLLLLTADHGQIDNKLAETFYLDQHDPGLVDLLRKDKRGEPIVPGGSSRDMFLYVQPDRVAEAYTRLTSLLGDKAEVRLTSDLIAEGYFGTTTPSPEFMSRVSELVILPRPGQLVYWNGNRHRFAQKYRGMHGGLTPQEMEIPFLALSYP